MKKYMSCFVIVPSYSFRDMLCNKNEGKYNLKHIFTKLCFIFPSFLVRQKDNKSFCL